MALSSPKHEPRTSLGDTAWILSSFLTGSHFCAYQHRSNNKVENPEKINEAQESETWASSWFILYCILGDFSSWSVCPIAFETVLRGNECLHGWIPWRESHFMVSRKLKKEEGLGSYYTLPGHTPSDPASSHSVKLLKTLPHLSSMEDLDGIRELLHMNQWGNSYPNLIKQPKDKVWETKELHRVLHLWSQGGPCPDLLHLSWHLCIFSRWNKKDRGTRH